MQPLLIGNVTIKNPLILAPMAGVTDLPFRLLCKEQGAGLVCMEMVSAKAIYYENKNTKGLLEIADKEQPVSLQLFGSDPEIISEMAKRIEERPFSILDLNMGCPVPKIVNNGEGSALMKNPVLAGKIIEATVRAIKKPVTVKIRKGFDEAHCNAAEMARVAQESGAAAVAVHARTREQYYSGRADWDMIRKVKENVKIPVIGNGDVTDGISAKKLIDQTGCDGIMIGRAAQGNPFIFQQIGAYLDTGMTPPMPTRQIIGQTVLRHADMQLQIKGEYTAVREMRKHIAWYSAGLPGSSKMRAKINEMESIEELKQIVCEVFLG